MKPRIRSSLLSDLAARSRLIHAGRYSSSASTSSASPSASTSSSSSPSIRRPRPRQSDFADEWRDQTLASDALLSSNSGGPSSSKTRRSSQPGRGLSPHTEEPVLKKNPWADQYKVKGDSDFGDSDGEILWKADDYGIDSIDDRIREAFNTDEAKSNTQPFFSAEDKSWKSHKGFRLGREVHQQDGDEENGNVAGIDADKANEGNNMERVLKFKTTETVTIRQGHIRYYHGENAEPRGRSRRSEFDISYHRLRDACPCPTCIDPSTRQRAHTSPKAFREINSSTSFHRRVPDVSVISQETIGEEEGLRINWTGKHSAFFPLSRLRAMIAPGSALELRLPNHGKRVLWARKGLDNCEHLHVQYQDLAGGSGREEMLFNTLSQLHTFGIVVIKGVPTDKTGDKDCSLREVMGWIGEIRNTFYGETWNVRNVANSKNVAYTDVNLGLHMDLLYFSSPPRFQALHCLRNRVEGGSSYFVDSFAAASYVLSENPDYASPTLDFEYDNDGHYLHHSHALMPTKRRQLYHSLDAAINWSPPFQGIPSADTAGRHPSAQMEWYQSLDAFEKALNQGGREWEFTMEEGDLVLFDNRRVLHARRAFRDLTNAEREEKGIQLVDGESSRWLKGCYLDGEVVWDKLATLNSQRNAK